MRFLSLFAGIGGFDLGLEQAGMQCVGQVEIDEYCNKVLSKHWPNVKRIKDIRNVKGGEFGTVELICGGFPCQPFSVAGKQRGKKDDRYLWPEMLRVIQAVRPHWILGENVTGIIKLALDKVLSDLEGSFYTCQTFIVPACSVDAPHRRDRVWIIAHRNNNRFWQQVQSISESGSKVAPNIRSNGKVQSLADPFCIISGGNKEWWPSGVGWWKLEPQEALQNARAKGRAQTRLSKIKPKLGRVADGVSNRVDRLRSLGNAVVPQVVEVIGRAILETENAFLNMESDNTCN